MNPQNVKSKETPRVFFFFFERVGQVQMIQQRLSENPTVNQRGSILKMALDQT